MAQRKRVKGGGGGSGGLKGGFFSVLMVVLIAAAAVAWWNVNGFTSVSDAVHWFQAKSDSMNACVDKNLPDGAAANDPRNLVNAHNCIVPGIGSKTSTKAPDAPVDTSSKTGITALAESIAVAPEQNVAYKRSEWRHWSDLDGNGCDSREDTLVKDGTNVVTDPSTCKVLSGTWTEKYSDTTTTDSSSLDIDHIVPLSWAAKNGGQGWAANVKEQFANDPLNLIISAASENRSKGDKGPADYLPPNKAFQCQYITSFVTVVHKYDLTMPQNDKTKTLSTIKDRC